MGLMKALQKAGIEMHHGNRIRYTLISEYPAEEISTELIDKGGSKQFNKQFYMIARTMDYEEPYAILDIGCAGGSMVKSFIQDGHNAIGIEGTDEYKKRKAFEWGVIPESLFTCDISKPFDIFLMSIKPSLPINKEFAKVWLKEHARSNEYTAKFDLITMWGTLTAGFKEEALHTMLNTVKQHLAENGLFVCSMKEIDRWDELFALHGFERIEILEEVGLKGLYPNYDENATYRVVRLKEVQCASQ